MDDNKFDEYILKLFDKVFEKLDKFSAYLDDLNKTLTRNTAQLEYHIKRTDQNDEKIELAQERLRVVEDRMAQELVIIRENGQKHEQNDILRFIELKEQLNKDMDEKLGAVIPLIRDVAETLHEKNMREKIEAENKQKRREKIMFWLKVLGGVSTLIGVIAGIQSL